MLQHFAAFPLRRLKQEQKSVIFIYGKSLNLDLPSWCFTLLCRNFDLEEKTIYCGEILHRLDSTRLEERSIESGATTLVPFVFLFENRPTNRRRVAL